MAVAYVQSGKENPGTGGTTVALTLTGVTSGNLLVAAVVGETGGDPTVSDDKGNTWTAINTVDSDDVFNPSRLKTFYAKNVAAGDTVITATLNVSTSYRAIYVHEVSGCDTTSPLDQQTTQLQNSPGTGTDACSSGSVTTTTDGQYIFGASITKQWTVTQSAGTNYTGRQSETNGPVCGSTEDRVQTSAGSIAATFTTNSGGGGSRHQQAIATFKAAGGGASAEGGGMLLGSRRNRLTIP